MNAPYNIQNYRYEQCKTCKTPCEFKTNQEWRADGDNACPIGRFMAYKEYKRFKLQGMGDVVALAAEPIASVMDKVLKTRVKGCGGCRKRREMLNQLMPFKL